MFLRWNDRFWSQKSVVSSKIGDDCHGFGISIQTTSPIRSAAMPTLAPAATGDGDRAASTPLQSHAPTTSAAAATAKTNPSTVAVAGAVSDVAATPNSLPCCDWAIFKCHMIGLPPIKCQKLGCKKYAHHVCAIEWVTANKLPEGGIETLCREHHPQACHTIRGSSAVAGISPIANTTNMTVSAVSADARGKSPIISTANKVNTKTAAKSKVNQRGEVVAAVKTKEVRIGKGVRVFSTKSQLIALVKKAIRNMTSSIAWETGFVFTVE